MAGDGATEERPMMTLTDDDLDRMRARRLEWDDLHRDDRRDEGAHHAQRFREDSERLDVEVRRLRTMLADCYRATGADPDGNEDWRLAEHAVAEVERLRAELDADAVCLSDPEGLHHAGCGCPDANWWDDRG